MQFPISFPFFNSVIELHTLAEYLGIFIGFRCFLFLRKQKGDLIESEKRIFIIIGAIFGAVLGSRLVGSLENLNEFNSAQNKITYILQNKSIVGGLIGGLFGVEIIKWFIGEKKKSGDLFVFPLLLAMFIGRIGCFSMGIFENTYGSQTNFVAGMDLGDGLRRHPVILYEMAFILILWMLLTLLSKKRKLAEGQLFKIFLIAYLVFRFFVEYLKPNTTYLFGLGTIQLSALIGLFYYALCYLFKKMNYLRQAESFH